MRAHTPAARAVLLMRRFKHTRPVRAGAYRLGEALGDRVLIGTTGGGSPMALSMRDHQHRAIYFHGEHEPDVTALFRRLVRDGCTVFDVGANAGYFSILSTELGARAHAFEPNPHVRALLRRSVQLGGGDITIVPAACSEQPGRLRLRLSDPANTGMSSVTAATDWPAADRSAADSAAAAGRSIEVDAITLDRYAAVTGARPSLIKIDVEGHEREALAGAESLLRDARPAVIAEVGGDDTLELMGRHGYAPQRILPDGSTCAHDGRLRLVGGYENVCFIPA